MRINKATPVKESSVHQDTHHFPVSLTMTKWLKFSLITDHYSPHVVLLLLLHVERRTTKTTFLNKPLKTLSKHERYHHITSSLSRWRLHLLPMEEEMQSFVKNVSLKIVCRSGESPTGWGSKVLLIVEQCRFFHIVPCRQHGDLLTSLLSMTV